MPPHGRVPGHGLEALDTLAGAVLDDGRKVVSCGHCGATASVASAELSTRCIYCLSSLSVSSQARPLAAVDAVVPFALTRQEAKTHFAKWLSALWFAPNALRSQAKLTGLRAIYLPVWLFSAHVETTWTASAGYLTSAEDDRKAGRKRPAGDKGHVRTRWENVSGTHSADYEGLLSSASKGLAPKELASMGPFELDRALAPFDAGFLAGFDAEFPGVSARQGWAHARHQIEQQEERACKPLVPGDEHRKLKVTPVTSEERFLLALLPVFVVAYAFRGEVYRVVVNGRTGQVEGDQPLSAVKVSLLLATIALVVGALWFAIA